MNTLLLDTLKWDLVLDASGNVAVASEPYAIAQDAASAVKTFRGEVYYDTTLGVPYFQSILGHMPPLSLVRANLLAAVMKVPGVVSAQVFISSFKDRIVKGQIQITDDSATTIPVNF